MLPQEHGYVTCHTMRAMGDGVGAREGLTQGALGGGRFVGPVAADA